MFLLESAFHRVFHSGENTVSFWQRRGRFINVDASCVSLALSLSSLVCLSETTEVKEIRQAFALGLQGGAPGSPRYDTCVTEKKPSVQVARGR